MQKPKQKCYCCNARSIDTLQINEHRGVTFSFSSNPFLHPFAVSSSCKCFVTLLHSRYVQGKILRAQYSDLQRLNHSSLDVGPLECEVVLPETGLRLWQFWICYIFPLYKQGFPSSRMHIFTAIFRISHFSSHLFIFLTFSLFIYSFILNYKYIFLGLLSFYSFKSNLLILIIRNF